MPNSDCIFCKIISGEIPCKKAYEDEFVLAFHDITPQAPVHILVIPKKHIDGMDRIDSGNADIAARLFTVISRLAQKLELNSGFRVVCNNGEQAGQSVRHLHFHLLAGRDLTWPPG